MNIPLILGKKLNGEVLVADLTKFDIPLLQLCQRETHSGVCAWLNDILHKLRYQEIFHPNGHSSK